MLDKCHSMTFLRYICTIYYLPLCIFIAMLSTVLFLFFLRYLFPTASFPDNIIFSSGLWGVVSARVIRFEKSWHNNSLSAVQARERYRVLRDSTRDYERLKFKRLKRRSGRLVLTSTPQKSRIWKSRRPVAPPP